MEKKYANQIILENDKVQHVRLDEEIKMDKIVCGLSHERKRCMEMAFTLNPESLEEASCVKI